MQCLNISLKKVFLLSPFYRWKLRLREMKYLTHGHSTSKWPAKLGLKLRSSDSMTHNPNDLPGGPLTLKSFLWDLWGQKRL